METTTTRVLLVDDHQMIREGLRAILEREKGIEIVGEACDGREALDMAMQLTPDIILMDVGMPALNGLEATRQIARFAANSRVIALSAHDDKRYVLAMLEAGARGYVVKAGAGEELVRAIHTAMRDQIHLSPAVAGLVVDSCVRRNEPEVEDGVGAAGLGSREREVLQLLAEGRSSPEIADIMHISVSTVETHRRNIMRKLDLHSVAELTKFAVREGLTML